VGKIIAFVISLFVKVNKAVYDKGFADGVAWANATANAEVEKRIAAAIAARADADALHKSGGVQPERDPYLRD
jgi:hypothetical protein